MFELPPLPYDQDALEPTISADTMGFHYGKHHKAYVDNLNKFLDEAGRKPSSLEDVVREAAGDASAKKIFNNAAQIWNHTFFWTCMTPDAQKPGGALAAAIDKTFGGLGGLKDAFVTEGLGHFGSGWVWLAAQGDALKVLSTHDGENLLPRAELTPLLVCDVWEHAYYLDHQNNRKGFLEGVFDKLAHWSFAGEQYAAATGGGQAWRHPGPV